LVLAEDLAHFDLRDIEGGFADIAKYPRREGETTFPELGRLKQAVIERKLVREADEIRATEAAQWEAHKAQCERERLEDVGKERTPAELRLDELICKAHEQKDQREEKERSRRMPPAMSLTFDEIKGAVARERRSI
jgi:hypothetical protein